MIRLILPLACTPDVLLHDWKAVVRFREAAGMDAVVPAATRCY